ncbi:MAG: sulfurtransferase TusA family protein [Proteobacteria bacterium]|nr:sulfurtransferase TusA family protein [Pseudomonadota bacterium]
MTEFNQKLDATGLNCPLPILKAKKQLNSLTSGEILYIVATDSGSAKDFDAFCKQTGHALLDSNEADGKYHFYIQKA